MDSCDPSPSKPEHSEVSGKHNSAFWFTMTDNYCYHNSISHGILYHQGVQGEPVQKLRLPFITELHLSRKRSIFKGRSNNRSLNFSNPAAVTVLEFPNRTLSTDTVTQDTDEYGAGVLKVGLLSKTSKGRSSKENTIRPGLTRQRRFRLTEEALEYFHHFSHVSLIMIPCMDTDINI